MFRQTITTARALARCNLMSSNNLQLKGINTSSSRLLQTSSLLNARDSKNIAASSESKDALNTAAIDVTGYTDGGITVPTLETHDQTLDGVPYSELPIIHVHATPNNTIITVTDFTGKNILVSHSCGKEGFRNIKKSTTVAAQATGLSAGQMVLKKGVKNVRVALKGLGVGRQVKDSVLKGLQMSGINIISLSDKTPIAHDAPRPNKARRL